MKKIPLRMCVITKQKYNKYDLIRVVKDKNNNIFVDPTGKMNGKGVYLKKDIDVIQKAKAKRILDNVLETETPDIIYEELLKIVGSDSDE